MAGDKDSTTYSTVTDINVKYLKDEDGNIISPVVSGESVFLPNDDKMLQEKIDSMDSLLVYASSENVGLMSAADKTKLDGITDSADSVSVTQNLTSGTKVGTITVNGTGTDLYAPAASAITFSSIVPTAHTLLSSTTLSPSASKSGSATFTKSGYYPIGLAGWYGNGNPTVRQVAITAASLGSCTVAYNAKNGDAGANQTLAITCYIMWAK